MKEKVKHRIKSLSKGDGVIKEEHRFPVINQETENKKDNFLNLEEADNLQDMINFAASINQSENKDIDNNTTPVDKEHSQGVVESQELYANLNANEKLDISFVEVIRR